MVATLVAGYAWVLLVVGILAVVLGIDRTLKPRKEESKLLKLLALVGGILMLALPVFVVIGGEGLDRIAPVSVLIMLVTGFALCARAMKRVPITFLVVAAVGVGLLILALNLQQTELAGTKAMTIIAVLMLAVLGGVFAASFTVESALDMFLSVLGFGLFVTAVGLIAAAQGLLIGAGLTGAGGLAEFL